MNQPLMSPGSPGGTWRGDWASVTIVSVSHNWLSTHVAARVPERLRLFKANAEGYCGGILRRANQHQFGLVFIIGGCRCAKIGLQSSLRKRDSFAPTGLGCRRLRGPRAGSVMRAEPLLDPFAMPNSIPYSLHSPNPQDLV